MSDITKGDNAKSKKGRVVILVCNKSSGAVSTFLPSIIKIFQRVFDFQSGHEINGLSLSNKTKGDKAKSKKGRVVILVHDTSTGPVLHFCQVPSKYSKRYSSYRADEKSISNKTKEDNSKRKKASVVILVHDMLSGPVLHFYQAS